MSPFRALVSTRKPRSPSGEISLDRQDWLRLGQPERKQSNLQSEATDTHLDNIGGALMSAVDWALPKPLANHLAFAM